MRNTNKKGFTIVELVVVVAVIAILAAVLIPTFSGIIAKANQSADQQAVTNMNKILATEIEKKAETSDEVAAILIANGYNGDLSTYSKDYKLAFLASENVIVLVEDNKVVFPKQYAGATEGFEPIKPIADKVTDGSALAGSLADGKVVFVAGNLNVADGLYIESAGNYAVNLGGNTLTSSNIIGSEGAGVKLVVSNGLIDGSAIDDDVVVYADEGGYVELNNVQVYSVSGANPLQCYGGTMVLNNVTTSQSGEAETAWYNSAIQVANNITYPEKDPVTNKHVIYGENANLTVNGGMYSGKRAIQISAPGGNITINDGNFIGTEYAIKADFNPNGYTHTEGKTYESVITINGGTFNGKIVISAATVLEINGGTFSIDPTTITTGTVTINGEVVNNGNGTWTVK